MRCCCSTKPAGTSQPELKVPSNITLLPLPAKAPELNPVENIWQYMRENWLSNRVFTSYTDILDHCCEAWNKLVDQPWTIMSIGSLVRVAPSDSLSSSPARSATVTRCWLAGVVMLGAIITNKPPVSMDDVDPASARLTGEYELIVVSVDSPIRSMRDLVTKL